MERAMFDDSLIDRIYEAAFNPDEWVPTLDGAAAGAGAWGGCISLVSGLQALGTRASAYLTEFSGEFVTDPGTLALVGYAYANPRPSFQTWKSFYPPEMIEASLFRKEKLKRGLDDEAFTLIPMPSGETAIVSIDRRAQDGAFTTEDIWRLNAIRPHLARAAMISARLRLERAQVAVATLETLGIPAAALAKTGVVRVSNGLFDTVTDRLKPAAFGGLCLAHAPAQALFQEAVSCVSSVEAAVRSIPVPPTEEGPALVIHVLPLRRSGYDVFPGGDVVVAVTEVGPPQHGASVNLLIGLFDLSPAEARLASSLTAGRSLQQAAVQQGIKTNTARSYLERIFAKTGTARQSELVLLLNGARPIRGG